MQFQAQLYMNCLETALAQHGWLHFYQMAHVGRPRGIPLVIDRGEGVYVYDHAGHRYIDGISGAYCVNVGYGRDRIVSAAKNAATRIHYVSPFTAANRFGVELSERLSRLAEPVLGPGSRVLFVNSGSEAIETAVKLARSYFKRVGRPASTKLISRREAYHGATMGALALSGNPDAHREFNPVMPGVFHVPSSNCASCQLGLSYPSCGVACGKEIDRTLIEEGEGEFAAVVLEPLETSGGIAPPPPGYMELLETIVREKRVLLIVDEVITGFGRLGEWFGSSRYGMKPDILVCAKGLTSGYESLGAVIVRKRVADAFLGSDEVLFAHGATFGGRPAAAAAALENLAIIEEEDLLQRTRDASSRLRELLNKELLPLPWVEEIRGDGLLFGVELGDDFGEVRTDGPFMEALHARICAKGLILCLYYTRTARTIEIAPPLIVSDEQCEEIVGVVRDALTEQFVGGRRTAGLASRKSADARGKVMGIGRSAK